MLVHTNSLYLSLNSLRKALASELQKYKAVKDEARRFNCVVFKKGEKSMRNTLKKSLGALMMCCMVLAMAAPSFAQWRGSSPYNRGSIDRLIRQAEAHSNQFVGSV